MNQLYPKYPINNLSTFEEQVSIDLEGWIIYTIPIMLDSSDSRTDSEGKICIINNKK